MKFAATVRTLAISSAALILAAQGAELAQADYFYSKYADDGYHTFFYDDDLTSRERSGMESARLNALQPTDMNTRAEPTYSNVVDAWVYNTYSPVGQQQSWYAWTTCVANVSGSTTRCEQFTIIFNEKLPHPNYASLGCHEIGHSIGFHDSQPGNNDGPIGTRSCMKANPDFTAYSDHDRGHINAHY